MHFALSDSYSYCQHLAKTTGKNFYFSFLTLPRPMFRDMCVLYAYMRLTDDIGDDPSLPIDDRRTQLANWRTDVVAALDSCSPVAKTPSPLPALVDIVARHQIPHQPLLDVIDGVASDLSPRTFATFDDLENYCYLVAGAVGLCCIHIWGFRGAVAKDHAISCGTAFQLTNILRDLREDAQQGRVYLPLTDLERFDYTAADLTSAPVDDRFRELMKFQVDRAQSCYDRGRLLFSHLNRPGRTILSAMFRIYGGLLREIRRQNYDVYTRRISLSAPHKFSIALGSLILPFRR